MTDQDESVEYALILGLIAGLIAQSVFEAWWTSPGSMESAIFWSALGVASALAQRQTAKRPAFTLTRSNRTVRRLRYRPAVRRASPD